MKKAMQKFGVSEREVRKAMHNFGFTEIFKTGRIENGKLVVDDLIRVFPG